MKRQSRRGGPVCLNKGQGPTRFGSQYSRRQFLTRCTLGAISVSGLSFLNGCAVDPVTGRKQLVMMSREQEIGIDKQQTPFQFSADYGVTQDKPLNQYIKQVGKNLLPHVHRPGMPYNFQCVNAVYINAYAFPGGSIAVTRGILLKLENEAELAALLGHELGHVNARHAAEQASRRQLSSVIIGGVSALAQTQGGGLGDLSRQLGALGQGLFLSKYSRDNEREADRLGHDYMVKAGYPSKGFVGLMDMLNSLNKSRPSSSQVLFSTHPMSSERLSSANQRDRGGYAKTGGLPLNRDRFMDHTAKLRRRRKTIELLQEGESLLGQGVPEKARTAFESAVGKWQEDYTARVLLAKCLLFLEKDKEAAFQARQAQKLFPSEPQGYYISGLALTSAGKYDRAFRDFSRCDSLLPGNPQLTFYKGYTQDKTGRQKQAANEYAAYLEMINYASNRYSQYAYNRLKEWGYVR